MSIFHLAIPSHDLEKSKTFYVDYLGATLGREYPSKYIIFKFFGHQLVTHFDPEGVSPTVKMYPRHYGIIFTKKEDFDLVYESCKVKNVPFFEEIFERYQNQGGWHFSFFISDPSNNLLEMKYYVNEEDIFN